jgi:hypothetical protein
MEEMREHTTMRRECFSIGTIPSERPVIYWHNLQTLCCEVESKKSREQKCSTLAITEELPRADLIAAGCKKRRTTNWLSFRASTTVNLSALRGAANHGSNGDSPSLWRRLPGFIDEKGSSHCYLHFEPKKPVNEVCYPTVIRYLTSAAEKRSVVGVADALFELRCCTTIMAHVDVVSQLKTLWAHHERRISVRRACYRFHLPQVNASELDNSTWTFRCPTFSNLSWPLSPCYIVRLSGRSLRFPNRSICSYCTTARHTIKGQTSSA